MAKIDQVFGDMNNALNQRLEDEMKVLETKKLEIIELRREIETYDKFDFSKVPKYKGCYEI